MILSTEDSNLYYQLWLPLVRYANEKYGINKSWENEKTGRIDTNLVKKVADRIWEDTSVIDRYLEEESGLPVQYREIIKSWKRKITGTFMLERHLKNGSIFISMDTREVYQVSGIVSSWAEMFGNRPLPILMEATLIPFKKVIITDGLVVPYSIVIGQNMSEQMREVYMSAKKKGNIHKFL